MRDLIKIGQLFDVEYGNKLDKNKMTEIPNGIHFVSRSSSDLGLGVRVDQIPQVEPYAAGLITVTLGGTYLLSAFVQPEAFYTAQNIKVLSPKSDMTFNEKVFYCLAISRNRFRYSSHGREANKTLDDILVPDFATLPEWVNDIALEIPNRASAKARDLSLSVGSWKGFLLTNIFEIKKGQRLTKANMNEGTTPFIGAIDSDNGYRQFVDATPNHAGNTISVNYNGSVAEAFYQPVPYWASDDVNVLYPRFEMTVLSAIFLCTLIRRERYRFNYGRKWQLERMVEANIRLPVTGADEPDWSFMEHFMESLPYSEQVAGG